ncbi:MAG: hypothetical protein AAFV29_16660, partial [Myxococcota bacterium]
RPEDCEEEEEPPIVTKDDFVIRTFEIENTASEEIVATGRSDFGELLLSLSNGDFYVIDVYGFILEAQQIFGITSIVRSGYTYFALITEDDSVQPYYGSISSLNRRYSTEPRHSQLHLAPNGEIMMVRGAGHALCLFETDICLTLNNERFPPPSGAFGEYSIANDPRGGFLLVGAEWSWRVDGVIPQSDLYLRTPFARIGSRLAFGGDMGDIRLPIPDDSDDSEVLANTRSPGSNEFFAPIVQLVSYENGGIAADSLGYINWIDERGNVEPIAHLIQEPVDMLVSERDIIVLTKDINPQIFSSSQSTNYTVHVLRRRDRP